MTLYPGVRAKMGRWTYYMVTMSMSELHNVKFAYEIEDPSALENAMQRALNSSRAKAEIATYLQRQPDRFFNSMVIACIGGEPDWFPISIEDDPMFRLVARNRSLVEAFGVLQLSGEADYFALDGQHRLAAIRETLNPASPLYQTRPEGFEHEQQSVVLVVPSEAETKREFMERFRRLFGHLNRYAKPMDVATSIIVEEDDVVAIATRRLFSRHKFFETIGPEKDSLVVDTTKGKNISNPRATHFTKLEVLYEMNGILLDSRFRQTNGWFDSQEKMKDFLRFRPEDEIIDLVYEELATYWDALLDVLPVLNAEASKMRNHQVVNAEDAGDEQDNLLFWPIGQQILAQTARMLLDQADVAARDFPAAVAALSPLSNIVWNLDQPPWKNLLLVPNDNGDWTMRSDNRTKIKTFATNLLFAACRGEQTDDVAWASLCKTWKSFVFPAMPDDELEAIWQTARKNLSS